ncbi:hypothetical protein TgHK011_004421 [Trichoderma gracile]|nr:hypothetical protein TgHK011_004421 [Trichoderma gracile]
MLQHIISYEPWDRRRDLQVQRQCSPPHCQQQQIMTTAVRGFRTGMRGRGARTKQAFLFRSDTRVIEDGSPVQASGYNDQLDVAGFVVGSVMFRLASSAFGFDDARQRTPGATNNKPRPYDSLRMQSMWSFALCNSQLPITVLPFAIGARRGLLQCLLDVTTYGPVQEEGVLLLER